MNNIVTIKYLLFIGYNKGEIRKAVTYFSEIWNGNNWFEVITIIE